MKKARELPELTLDLSDSLTGKKRRGDAFFAKACHFEPVMLLGSGPDRCPRGVYSSSVPPTG